MSQLQTLINQAIELVQPAQHLIALTGAGISTRSGIPDFRSPQSGLWEHADPAEVASIYSFRETPQLFYDWFYPLVALTVHASPNAAHLALRQMEQKGVLAGIITQNIDMLHTKAGSQKIYELHGHMRKMSCMRCLKTYDSHAILTEFLATKQVPICAACAGVLKPNIVLFGELLPLITFRQAEQQAKTCDVMLVAGSSLEVSPAGDLPLLAKQYGAKLVFVNLLGTHLDAIADVVIRADVVDVLPELANAI